MENKKSKYLTIEETIELPDFGETAVSEDGRLVAYVIRSSDWEDNTYRNHVWIDDTAIRKNYPVTVGKSESKHPRWSPDSGGLAYLSPVGHGDEKKDQIFIH